MSTSDYTPHELKTALLAEGSFARYWMDQLAGTRPIRMPDVVDSRGHAIPRYLQVTVVEVYGTPTYDSYGYLESGYEAGIVFKIGDDFWKVIGAGGSYGVHFGDWWDDGNEIDVKFVKVTKKTKTVSQYV